MTIKGNDMRKDAVARTKDEEEVPSYQEAVAASSTSNEATQQSSSAAIIPPQDSGKRSNTNVAAHQVNLYPFPSMPIQPGYGQSPYQIDGTARIVIVANDGLPLHATGITPGPPAGKRFLQAFFWAFLLYLILGAIMGTVMQMEENAHQPRTPPGWHHHHHPGHKSNNSWNNLSIRLNKWRASTS